jgi:adenosine 3'-phospho 5'-phosphosulfate transporter B3
MDEPDRRILLFSLNVTTWPRWILLAIGTFGIFTSFLLQGATQEALYKRAGFGESIFLTFVQFTGYSLPDSPYLIRLARGRTTKHASLLYYAFTSFCLVCSMGFSNLSIERLSYPTSVLFKSSKLIPVMIGGLIFLKKRYTLAEVLAVLLIVTGLIGISLSDKISKNQFDGLGVIFCCISLAFDAIASNLQDKAMSQYGASQAELLSMVYFIGAGYLLLAAVFSGQLAVGVKMCIDKSVVAFYVASFIVLGSVGAQFVYLLMKTFGSLITVMVTSTRKAFTVCLSFLVFRDKKFTLWHGLSICCIAGGLTMNTMIKNKKAKNSDGTVEERMPLIVERTEHGVERPLEGGFGEFDGEKIETVL